MNEYLMMDNHGLDSTCTTNTIKQYLRGTVPEDKGDDGPDVFCEVDVGPFDLRECSQVHESAKLTVCF
jgi:hypothetical protein